MLVLGKVTNSEAHTNEKATKLTMNPLRTNFDPARLTCLEELQRNASFDFRIRAPFSATQMSQFLGFTRPQRVTVPTKTSSTTLVDQEVQSKAQIVVPVFDRPMIEIAPDYFLPLRGSKETTHAILQDKVVTTVCIDCQALFLCIDSATMVLCPCCRSVNPVSNVNHAMLMDRMGTESLGLGITMQHATDILETTS